MATNDIAWREHNIHGDDREEDKAFVFNLFDQEEDPFQLLEFEFGDLPKILVKGQPECPNSTGLAIWVGAETLCGYLVRHPNLIRDKQVLELGAGTGLVGLTAHHLEASHVFLTDGDKEVLKNLRFNVEQNLSAGDSDKRPSVSCPQLIWGKDLEAFKKIHGQQDVIIATDCVYMEKALRPIWETVHQLLKANGTFICVNIVGLNGAPDSIEHIQELGNIFGFTGTRCSDDSARGVVYLFRRKPKA